MHVCEFMCARQREFMYFAFMRSSNVFQIAAQATSVLKIGLLEGLNSNICEYKRRKKGLILKWKFLCS